MRSAADEVPVAVIGAEVPAATVGAASAAAAISAAAAQAVTGRKRNFKSLNLQNISQAVKNLCH